MYLKPCVPPEISTPPTVTENPTGPSVALPGATQLSKVDDNTVAGTTTDADPNEQYASPAVKPVPVTLTTVPPDTGPSDGLTDTTVAIDVYVNVSTDD